MQTKDLEDAVRKVLLALNLRPEGFELDAGFLQRALRSGQPRVVNVNSPARLFVYLGERGSHDPQAGVEGLASEALATLTDDARQRCEHVVVGWNNPQGQVFAAAFAVAPDGRSGALTALSWTNPETWPEPMIDISKPTDDAIQQLLARLQALVENHANRRDSKFHMEIKRVLKLTDMQLLLAGGETQGIDALPPTGASDAAWARWLDDFKLSVETEWARIGGAQRSAAAVAARNPNGPLKGMLVFLSYRRTDATLLALPVYQALLSCGAEVWFDRAQLPDQSLIAVGLEEAITKCDAYILCASDEFFEGSGYATQEFAWAVRGRTPEGKLQRFAVVVAPGTILPDAIASWPTIPISEDVKELTRRLADALLQPTPFVPGSPSRVRLPPPAVLSPLPRQADLPHLFRRARHTQWFEELRMQDIERLIAQGANDRQTQVLREKLLKLCDEADWNGTMQDIHQWPDDPLIRDVRLRFASVRAVCLAGWPLSDDLSCKLGVAPDVEYLATQRVPIMDWPGAVGWDDNERRFALRHHIGILRLLQTLLRCGLAGGLLLEIGTSTWDAWERELTVRRRECYDAILALRLDDRLSWEDVLTWDRPFHAWRDVLEHDASAWRGPVPPQVLQLLAANATAVAAVAAEVGWYVSRRGGLACQAFSPQAVSVPMSIEVYTFARTGREYRPHPPVQNTVRVGLVADGRDRMELRVEWNGPEFFAPLPAGVGSRAAPEELYRVMSFFKA